MTFDAALTCVRSTPPCSGPEARLDLHLNAEPRSGTYAGMVILLVSLQPVPDEPGSVRAERYVAWIRVQPAAG